VAAQSHNAGQEAAHSTASATADPPAQHPPADDAESRRHRDRWVLVWDVLVFQVKLGLDALRDILLSPLSFGALLLGLFAGGNDPYRYFARLLRFGRKSERVINLFGTARIPYTPYDRADDKLAVDRLFGGIEELVKRNVHGSQTATAARDKVDGTIDELEARLNTLRAKAKAQFDQGMGPAHGPRR